MMRIWNPASSDNPLRSYPFDAVVEWLNTETGSTHRLAFEFKRSRAYVTELDSYTAVASYIELQPGEVELVRLSRTATSAQPFSNLIARIIQRHADTQRSFDQAAVDTDSARVTTHTLTVPPGVRLRGVLDFIYSRRTMERVFEPALADMQAEWLDAVVAGRQWKARWVRFRGYASLGNAIGLHSAMRLLKQAVKLWRMG